MMPSGRERREAAPLHGLVILAGCHVCGTRLFNRPLEDGHGGARVSRRWHPGHPLQHRAIQLDVDCPSYGAARALLRLAKQVAGATQRKVATREVEPSAESGLFLYHAQPLELALLQLLTGRVHQVRIRLHRAATNAASKLMKCVETKEVLPRTRPSNASVIRSGSVALRASVSASKGAPHRG